MMITVIACDDHAIVCAGIERVLSTVSGVSFLGSALTAPDLISKVERDAPSIVLLDINLGETSGFDLIESIAAVSPKTKVVFFSMYDGIPYVRRARELGAAGYVTKDRLDGELVQILRTVAAGDEFVSSVSTTDRESREAAADLELLSSRELEVLTMLADGMTNGEIARVLFLSRRTVESHRARIQLKLGLKTRAELAKALIGRDVAEPHQGAPPGINVSRTAGA